jgi:signal transduction histidine kinase
MGDGGLSVTVRDTGIGMAPEKIGVALEPFKQLDSSLSRRFDGIGLGLPIARALVVLHGGTMTIESALGQGTAVTLNFPASRMTAARSAAA